MIYEDIYFILIGTGMKSCSKLSNIAKNSKENSENKKDWKQQRWRSIMDCQMLLLEAYTVVANIP